MDSASANPVTRRGGDAFTLIELLVVTAIISILTSIAMPHFLEAVTRSNVTRAKGDMKAVANALEMYRVDWKAYPQAVLVFSSRRLRPLTTPSRFLESLPEDPFSESEGRSRTYSYGAMDLRRADRFLLASRGPDRNGNTTPIEFYPGNKPGLFIGELLNFRYMIYSPTNGTISRGDLYQASDATP
ncbi:MAG: type II secretion system protein GspG [Candidatus Omnitrophica bacterium]|nr:hypothetical protein [bacterium]NUN95894.1 type II secretion system protein GspG [Candidatus Omnitrophota bacterium]